MPRDLSGLLGSRLCHDLISPVGAISNGLELVGMTATPQSAEMQLVAESVRNAQARIRFFRVAFGTSRADQALGSPELSEVLAGVYGVGRLTVVWNTKGEVARDQAKLAFLLILCIEAGLSRGGTIEVTRHAKGWTIAGAGQRYRDLADFWPELDGAGATADITPERVQFPLALLQAKAAGFSLCVRTGNDGICIEASRA